MIWYFVFPVFVFFYATIGYKSKITGYIILFLLLFFSMFRGDLVGTDTIHYLERSETVTNIFTNNDMGDVNGQFDILYYWLCVFVTLYDWPPRVIIYFFSITTFLFLYLGVRRMKLNLALFCMFYVMSTIYIYSMNVARQTAALSIAFYAMSYLEDKGKKRFLFFIWIFIASLLHNSMFILIILYLCRIIHFNRNKIGKTVTMFYSLLILLPVSILMVIVFKLLSIIGLGIFTESLTAFGSDGISIFSIVNKLLFGWLCIYIYYKRSNDDKTDMYDNMFILSLLAVSFFSGGNLMFFRVRLNFIIIQCLFFTIYFSRKKFIFNNEYVWLFILNILMVYWVSLLNEPYYLNMELKNN